MLSKRALLAVACVVGLSSGTNYIYSGYAPQLGAQLGLSQTQSAVVGAAGNMGVYLSSPFIGRIVDRRGPTRMLLFASVAIFVGYFSIRVLYLGGEDGLFSVIGVPGLALAEFAVGAGSTAGLSGASNSVAKSYKKQRATALSLVLSAFGLSAFFYSTVWRTFLHSSAEPTSSFLLLLALGTGFSMLFGAALIRAVPVGGAVASNVAEPAGEQTSEDEESDEDAARSDLTEVIEDDTRAPTERTPLKRSTTDTSTVSINVSGWNLLRETDFWLLFLFNGCCSGVGLMYINNLGTVIRSLAPPSATPAQISLSQANLVSLLSVFNCAGRIVTGSLSDYGLHHAPQKWRFSRVWWNVSTASLYAISQILASAAVSIHGPWGLITPTILTGFAHGSLFGVSGVLILERFGIKTFSSNNGIVAMAPAFFGQATNFMFGRIYDHHVPAHSYAMAAADRTCRAGRDCYVTAFHITTAMAVVAICLGIVLSNRQSMKRRAA